MSETNTLVMTRTADTWPSHRSKAKKRHLTRKQTARAAQAERDKVRGNK